MDLEAHLETVKERWLQATFGLWNALLTVNGVMLTVFSVLYVAKPGPAAGVLAVLVGCCITSVFVILLNHVVLRATYTRLAEVASGASELTEAVRERDLRLANRRHWVMKLGEPLAIALLVVEVALTAYLVYGVAGPGGLQP